MNGTSPGCVQQVLLFCLQCLGVLVSGVCGTVSGFCHLLYARLEICRISQELCIDSWFVTFCCGFVRVVLDPYPSLQLHCVTEAVLKNMGRAQHIPLPDGLGQVKLPMRQMNFGKVFFEIIYNLYWKCIILEIGYVNILDTLITDGWVNNINMLC